MPPEDKLTHNERLRLECIAQAINFIHAKHGHSTTNDIIEIATKFESYIREKPE